MEDTRSLRALCRPNEYRQQREQMFPSAGSMEWYLRINRSALVESGALLLHAKQWFVVPEKFDGFVLERAQREAQRKLGQQR